MYLKCHNSVRVCRCTGRIPVVLGHAPGERHERLHRLATVEVRIGGLHPGTEHEVVRCRPRRHGPAPVRSVQCERAVRHPGRLTQQPPELVFGLIGHGLCLSRHGPVQKTEERAVQQRRIGGANGVVAEQ